MSDTQSAAPQKPYLRRATPEDSPALSHICLVTADAGVSAASQHSAGELPGLIYAEPYVHLPTGFGFVLVDPSRGGESGQVVGYVLGTYDTRQFERELEEQWYPKYREKYPLSAVDAEVTDATPPHLRSLTPGDKRYIALIAAPHTAPDACVQFSPAHMHIDILPEYQRQGWGKKMIGELVRVLRDEKGLEGLWLGLDPRNAAAKKFYERLGFVARPEWPGVMMSLKFEDWKD